MGKKQKKENKKLSEQKPIPQDPGDTNQQVYPETLGATLDLLTTQEYHDGFLDAATLLARKEVSGHEELAQRFLMRAVGVELDASTATQLGISVDQGKKSEDWSNTRNQVASEVDESGKSFRDRLTEKHKPAVFTEEHKLKSEELESVVVRVAEQASIRLEQMLLEIETRKSDQDFLEAVSLWANSPNSKGEVGQDGNGFNAGIVHFFEYRASLEKAGRFYAVPEELSVDGFIEYTHNAYKAVAAIIDPENAEVKVKGARLRDVGGAERLIAYSNGDKIIGFKAVNGERIQMTTIIPGQNPEKLAKEIADILAGNDRGILNKLSGPAELITQV